MTGEQIKDIDNLQEDWERYKKQGTEEKIASLELCVPFSIKYNISTQIALKLAKQELTIEQVIKIFNKTGSRSHDKYCRNKCEKR